jgi:HlyD family secretion protein
MGHPSIRRIAIPVIVVALAVTAYVLIQQDQTANSGLQASGTVEAAEIVVAPEVGGRVKEVRVGEGDAVEAGRVLFIMDEELLTAQRARAVAGLQAAQAAKTAGDSALALARLQYDAALDAARLQEAATRSSSWRNTKPEVFDLPVWYFEKAERIAAADRVVGTAAQILEDRRGALTQVLASDAARDLREAETRLAEAEAAYRAAESVVRRAELARDTQELLDAARDRLDLAEEDLESAQEHYDELLSSNEADEVLRARAEVAVAQADYDAAVDARAALRSGAEARSVELAAAAVDQASANLASIEAAIGQAQAEIDVIDLQIDRMEIRAPTEGVILVSDLEAGEVIPAGAAVMTLGRLEDLRITVYVDEAHYGQIEVGEVATVRADSFPGQSFEARVVRIADRAEFTPRNVQTEEGRRTTMFAVELSVVDPEGRLKPGMPVDVQFVAK